MEVRAPSPDQVHGLEGLVCGQVQVLDRKQDWRIKRSAKVLLKLLVRFFLADLSLRIQILKMTTLGACRGIDYAVDNNASSTVEIPYSTDQGIILEEQGNFLDVTENFQRGAGKFTWQVARRKKSCAWMEF